MLATVRPALRFLSIPAALGAFLVLGAASGCGGGGGDGTCVPTGTQKSQYAADTFTVPQEKTDYAIDVNGDGTPDNQLGQILSFLASSGLDPQKGVDDALNDGQLVVLVEEDSSDATFQSDGCAGTKMALGVSATMKLPAANEQFTISSAVPPASFNGKITAGTFTSQSQLTVSEPISLDISLPFLPGTDPVPLTITGATVRYTRDASGNFKSGQINGVVKGSDLKDKLIPGFATVLTQKVQRNLGEASTNMQILNLFDTGGDADQACPMKNGKGACRNPDMTCAVADDGKIDTCEVSTSFIQFVLVPDVQMYDGAKWAPSKANTTPDSLSLGIGLTAVPAKF